VESQDIGNQANNANLWKRLSSNAKDFVKSELIKTVAMINDKQLLHKVCNLMIEVGGTLYD
jgi:hypothetical protein